MRIISMIFMFGVFIVLKGYSDSPKEIYRAWQERAFTAVDWIENNAAGKSKLWRYKLQLEMAFKKHATKESDKKLSNAYKRKDGVDNYALFLFKDINTKSFFRIKYRYDSEKGVFIGTQIDALPEGWLVKSDPVLPNTVILDVNDSGIVFVFDIKDPFKSYVKPGK